MIDAAHFSRAHTNFRHAEYLCSQDAVNATTGNNGQAETTGGSCDLSTLDPLCNDSEEFLRQLAENPFELDSFFTEYTAVDVKVTKIGPASALRHANMFAIDRRRTTTCRIRVTQTSGFSTMM